MKLDRIVYKLVEGNCAKVLKRLPDDSIDLIVTDPPYGIAFMGKNWDKALPSIDTWYECLRVLKPGAFAFVMCTPRQDCLSRMIVDLEDVGFAVNFTSIYWVYAHGFPKASNISKMIDKRAGAEREVVGYRPGTRALAPKNNFNQFTSVKKSNIGWCTEAFAARIGEITLPVTPEAKQLDGAYAGLQLKPALEPILCVMKPLSEKSYLDQALANGKGCTWLDDCRIPTKENLNGGTYCGEFRKNANRVYGDLSNGIGEFKQPAGRFPANMLVGDDALNDGKANKSTWAKGITEQSSFSRFFDLDAWFDARMKELPEAVQKIFPFLNAPKPSVREKNRGIEGETKKPKPMLAGGEFKNNPGKTSSTPRPNYHPTVKAAKLMAYLITLGSRSDDLILDPFMGSGTTGIAARLLGRRFLGIELDPEYLKIARGRIRAADRYADQLSDDIKPDKKVENFVKSKT